MNPTEYRFGDYRLLPAARELWQDGQLSQHWTSLAWDAKARTLFADGFEDSP